MGHPLKELLVTRKDAKQVKEMDATTGTLKQEQEIDPTSTAALETGKHLIYSYICIHMYSYVFIFDTFVLFWTAFFHIYVSYQFILSILFFFVFFPLSAHISSA